MDDAGEAALMSTVTQLKAKNKTVFLITHRPGAIGAADWLLLLKDGELVASGPRDEVIATLQKSQRPARGAEPSSALTPRPA